MSFRVTFDSGDNTLSCNLGKCECVLHYWNALKLSEVQNLVLFIRLGDANKYVLLKQSIIMCKRMTLSEERLMVEFLAYKRVNFSYAGSFSGLLCLMLLFVLNSQEMNRKSFSYACLCEMLLFTHAPVVISHGWYPTTYYFWMVVILLFEVRYFLV